MALRRGLAFAARCLHGQASCIAPSLVERCVIASASSNASWQRDWRGVSSAGSPSWFSTSRSGHPGPSGGSQGGRPSHGHRFRPSERREDRPASAARGEEEDESSSGRTFSICDEEYDDPSAQASISFIKGLNKGSQRVVFESFLKGRIMEMDSEGREQVEALQKPKALPAGLKVRVVDVKRTSKGTRGGGLSRMSALVVVGNGAGVLGLGQGKASELGHAVKKATRNALKGLQPVPRFNEHTVTQALSTKVGQVRMNIYPKSAGSGIVAQPTLRAMAKLAGIHDVGIKVHGSCAKSNVVKCLFQALCGQQSAEEIMRQPGMVVVPVVPGRFGRAKQSKAWA